MFDNPPDMATTMTTRNLFQDILGQWYFKCSCGYWLPIRRTPSDDGSAEAQLIKEHVAQCGPTIHQLKLEIDE